MTVLRDVSVGEVKDALLFLIGRELSRDLLVLAEVKEKSIVRVLVRDNLKIHRCLSLPLATPLLSPPLPSPLPPSPHTHTPFPLLSLIPSL